MAEVVNKGLPLAGVDVILLQNEIRANVHAENLNFDGGAATQLLKTRIALQGVDMDSFSTSVGRKIPTSGNTGQKRGTRFRFARGAVYAKWRGWMER